MAASAGEVAGAAEVLASVVEVYEATLDEDDVQLGQGLHSLGSVLEVCMCGVCVWGGLLSRRLMPHTTFTIRLTMENNVLLILTKFTAIVINTIIQP